MIFSKLILNINNPSARQALRNCQDMHRNLMRAFEDDRKTSGLLYRIVEHRDRIEIFTLSRVLPDWTKIEKLGYLCAGVRDISALREKYRENSVIKFDLLASPTKKCKFDIKNSRRVFLRSENERLDWLHRQAEKCGFRIMEAHETGIVSQVTGLKGERIRFGAVNFNGILRIVDAESFWNSYLQGIGAEKSYGMGMLMLLM